GDAALDGVRLAARDVREDDGRAPRPEAEVRRGDAVGVLLAVHHVHAAVVVDGVVAGDGVPAAVVEVDETGREEGRDLRGVAGRGDDGAGAVLRRRAELAVPEGEHVLVRRGVVAGGDDLGVGEQRGRQLPAEGRAAVQGVVDVVD